MVRIARAVVEAIKEDGRKAYPEEGCGYLIGPDETPRVIEEARPGRNIATEDRRVRYNVDPEETLRLTKELRGTGREIIGFFHSHPDHPARPSLTDLSRAWTWYTYVIVSVERGRPVDMRAWSLDETESERSFREEGIEPV